MGKQAKNLRKLSAQEREKLLAEIRLQLIKDRAQAASGAASKKPSSISNGKRMIARIHTLKNE